ARNRAGVGKFFEVFLDCPLDLCEERDPKGLYKKARSGEIEEFTGIDSPYEVPDGPELVLDTGALSIEECAGEIVELLEKAEIIKLKGSGRLPLKPERLIHHGDTEKSGENKSKGKAKGVRRQSPKD
ncbi:MAG: adenylyl-sulfate kinase, partial [bacterium]|nr:adenylyl-sulfate kinase [bacterium]